MALCGSDPGWYLILHWLNINLVAKHMLSDSTERSLFLSSFLLLISLKSFGD
jgi:hypothetical protein